MRHVVGWSLVLALFVVSCADEEADCSAIDTVGQPVQSGTYEGTFSYDGSDKTFPMTIVVDTETQTFSGILSFQDGDETFSGTSNGTVDPASGAFSGSFEATSDGFLMAGDMTGEIDAQQACGTWSNVADQGGPWELSAR